MREFLRTFRYVLLLGTVIGSLSSCNKDDDPINSGLGTITGVVTDDTGAPISGVTVTVSGINETDLTATTGSDGTYTVENVSLKIHAVAFSKTGWLTIGKSVNDASFDAGNVATVNTTLINASAKITGSITDAKNSGAPLSGVTVTVGVAGTAQSATDGTFSIENLIEDTYTVTFTKDNYVTLTKAITKADFVGGVVTLNVTMGGTELLRGLTADDLAAADKWHFNEYRGGRNADAYPHWDWACDYMCTLDFRGAWEEQNEGTTLQIRNNGDEQKNPADLTVFDSFVFGSKAVTDDNKIMSLRIRTHNSDATNPAYWGVQVVDLSAAQPTAVKVGGDRTYGSGDYADIDVDLSAYIGKEIIIAVGIYRQATGDYWHQLVLRAIRFADKKVEGTDWLPGTEAIAGWKLPLAAVRSTMPQAKKSFTGMTKNPGNRDNYVGAYREWRENDHVGATWSFVPLKKDPEVFPSEGYLIKTNNTADVDTNVPQAYIYSKFSIAPGNNQLTLSTRNFSTNATYFKLTAIEDDGTVTHVAPSSNTAQQASAADNGCWKFVHQNGGSDHPENYASFVYDLSQFNGRNVLLAFGVYNGEGNTGENKLVFHSIDLD